MDYSIGSLSDLITGSNTPNKKKVVKKRVAPTKAKSEIRSNMPVPNDSLNNEKPTEEELNRPMKKKIKTGQKKNKIGSSEGTAPKKSIKQLKRKRTTDEENEPLPKKSKNSENAGRRIASKEKVEKLVENPELLARTIFVGNLPITSNTKKCKRFFAKYGKVETVRIRGVPVANPKTPKKVAMIKKEFHPDRKSFYGFVRFEERESAIKATEANGAMYQDHHLRVHLCDATEKPDENKAIFVGNLSFYAEEDDLWQTFESCGPISSVRIVRDGRTGMGKGFGYVNFVNSDSVTLALEMENIKIKERELRISVSNVSVAKKNKKNKTVKKISKPGKPKIRKNFTKIEGENANVKQEGPQNVKKSFQGVKFADKKKKKFNKGLLQKKKIIKKIAPK